jgi:phospholipase/carboxylesterase
MLHGAGGRAINALSIVRAEAQRRGVIVVAPKSSSASWDVLRGGFGPDVATIDQALENAFTYHAVDPKHIAIGGFSDGASYALTLGVILRRLSSVRRILLIGGIEPILPCGRCQL